MANKEQEPQEIDTNEDSSSGETGELFLRRGTTGKMRPTLRERAFLIPSFITVIGIFCGFLAIVYAFHGRFGFAARYILVAAIADFLDGRVARRLNATSAFGKELDSLADLVAFGVAPAVLFYAWSFQTTAEHLGVLIAFIYVACGATRLARFNVTSDSNTNNCFIGLPIPGAAAVMVSLVLVHPEAVTSISTGYFLMGYCAVVATLMVSQIQYPSIKHIRVDALDRRLLFLAICAAVSLAWYNFEMSFLIGTVAYGASGPAQFIAAKLKHLKST